MKPFSPPKAQVTIETTALAVLAIIALLVMSSYVVRGINAYFKKSQDTVKDSFHETMLQSGQLTGPECTCEEEVSEDCGVGNCSAYEELVSYVCSPPECPVPASYCRINRDKCCRTPDACAAHGCPNGQRAFLTSCPGETPETYECETDNDCLLCCDATAPEIINNPNLAEYCDSEDDDPVCPASLKGDYAYLVNTGFTFVEDHVGGDPAAGNGCTGAPCELICKDPLAPQNGSEPERGSICDCEPPDVWDNELQECVCVVQPRYGWVQKPEGVWKRKSCETLCEEHGGESAPDPNGMVCLSGENQLCSGVIQENIRYWWGTWGSCAHNTYSTYERYYDGRLRQGWYCWHSGQTKDYDDTDRTVACHCYLGLACGCRAQYTPTHNFVYPGQLIGNMCYPTSWFITWEGRQIASGTCTNYNCPDYHAEGSHCYVRGPTSDEEMFVNLNPDENRLYELVSQEGDENLMSRVVDWLTLTTSAESQMSGCFISLGVCRWEGACPP